MLTSITVILALFLDRLLGEPKGLHPLVGFGVYADAIENKLNIGKAQKLKGIVACLLAIAPFLLAVIWIDSYFQTSTWLMLIVSVLVVYLCIGWQSLIKHAANISQPLRRNDIYQARLAIAMMVSRDTENLEKEAIARAATESVLENGADAIFSAIFWFCVAGIPGVVVYRLSNTLDAMWGYKNERFLYFGWAAARLDDVMNFIPARLTALSYAIIGNTKIALSCWWHQGFSWKSPNAGPVMAAGAGALKVSLGGAAQYHNKIQHRQALGPGTDEGGRKPAAESIEQACTLVNRAVLLWVMVIFIVDYFL